MAVPYTKGNWFPQIIDRMYVHCVMTCIWVHFEVQFLYPDRRSVCVNACILIWIIFLHVHTRLCGCVSRWCSQHDVVLLSTTTCLDALPATLFPRRHSILTTLCTQRQVQRQIVQICHTPVNTWCNDHHLKQGFFSACFIRNEPTCMINMM